MIRLTAKPTKTVDLPFRTKIERLSVCTAFLFANTGLLVLSFNSLIQDRWSIFALEAIALGALVVAAIWGIAYAWLVIGGTWIYASVIAMLRIHSAAERAGIGLIFIALSFSALAAYVGTERGEL